MAFTPFGQSDWLQQALDDKKKRDQNAQKTAASPGGVNYAQAAKSSRVQYTDPVIASIQNNKSADASNTSYQWEKDLLGNIKGGGRSYKDRFSHLTQALGMTEGQANDFRSYLNFQENQGKSIKTTKTGKVDNRSGVTLGQGAQTTGQMFSDIMQGAQNNALQSISDMKKASDAEQKARQKVQQVAAQGDTGKGWYQQLNNQAQRLGNQFWQGAFGQGVANDNLKFQNDLSQYELQKDPTNQKALSELKTLNSLAQPSQGIQKVTDPLANMLGYAAPYLVGGAPQIADATLGKMLGLDAIKNPIVKDLTKGLSVGAVGGAERQAELAATGQQNDYQDAGTKILEEAALGGAGDAVLGSVLRNLNLKGQLAQALQGSGTKTGVTQDQMQQALQAAFSQKGNVSNVLADAAKPNQADQVQTILNQMGVNLRQPTPKGQPTWADFKPGDVPQVDIPSVLNELAQPKGQANPLGSLFDTYRNRPIQTEASGQIIDKNGPIGLNAPQGPLGLNEPLMNPTVQGLGKDVQVHGTPQLEAPRVKSISTEQDLQDALGNLEQLQAIKKQAENDHIQQAMAPHMDHFNQQSQAEALWQSSVKNAKDIAANIKDQYGKIELPKGNKADFNIPAQFKANSSQKGYDIYSFATDEGFSSVDEAVKYLQNLDKATKTRLKDMMPNDAKKYSEQDIKALEDQARQSFNESQHGKGYDQLIADHLKSVQEYLDKQGAPDLAFKIKQKFKVDRQPVNYVGKMDPNQQSVLKTEGNYTTRQADSPSGDTLKMNVTKPASKEQPFKKSAEVPRDLMNRNGNFTDSPSTIKDNLAGDPKVQDAIKALNDLAPGKAGADIAKTLDFLLNSDKGRTVNTTPKGNLKPNELLQEIVSGKRPMPKPKSEAPKTENVAPKPSGKGPTKTQLKSLLTANKEGDQVKLPVTGKEFSLKNTDAKTVQKHLKDEWQAGQKLNESMASIKTPQDAAKVLKDLQNPKQEAAAAQEAKQKPFMRLDLQQHNNEAQAQLFADTPPIESKTAINSVKNPVMRVVHKFREGYLNRTESARVAHAEVLKSAIKHAEENGMPKKAEQLKGELKMVQRTGSSFEQSLQNVKAAGAMASSFLEKHMSNLQEALGSTNPKEMADALRYQFAKNIQWIRDNVNPDYVVGKEWDPGRINSIVNQTEHGPKAEQMKSFLGATRKLTQAWRDEALKYDLITKTQHEALSKNPFYIPMARDISQGMDNIARGLKGNGKTSSQQTGMFFVHKLGDGDAEALYKNPLDTIIQNTFSLFSNTARADAAQQALKLAKLDKSNLFFRVVGKKSFDNNGGLAVHTPNGTKYVQLQEDLMKMVKESDLPVDLNTLGKITSAFAGLKTRSLEYHMTGVLRDIAEGYLKGRTDNPITYLKEVAQALGKGKNEAAKESGAFFNNSFKDGMDSFNNEKMMKEFAKQYKGPGEIKAFNPKDKESWKSLVSTVGKIADMPFKPIKALGQWSDETPRSIEIKQTQKIFMKQHGKEIKNLQTKLGEVNQQLEAAKTTPEFDPARQQIGKLEGQKQKIQNMLNQYNKDLQREMTYRGRDIMNFSNGGRSGIAKHLRQYVIFANTATQSKDKLLRTLIERPGPTIAKIALLTAPLVTAEMVNHQNLKGSDKKIYDNLPFYAKQYNYVYVNNGRVYTLPKIQELALVTDPIEAMITGQKGDLPDAARNAVKELVPYQMGNYVQGLVPNSDGSVTMRKNMQDPLASTILGPLSDVKANEKLGFNNNPISYADQFNRKNPKANSWTLDVLKKVLGDNPRADYANYIGTSYGGDYGKYGLNVLNALLAPSKGNLLQAAQNINPLQDRIKSNNSSGLDRFFPQAPKKSKVTGK